VGYKEKGNTSFERCQGPDTRLQKFFRLIIRDPKLQVLELFKMPDRISAFTTDHDVFQIALHGPLIYLPPAHAQQFRGFPDTKEP